MQEFDYVVVGGGAAGCVVAGRLSEDPSVSVCLLEAGGPDSVVRAICELSPARANEKGHQKVADWVDSVAPKYLQQYEAKRGRGHDLMR